MCQFIETLQVLDGKVQNLALHQARLNTCFKRFYNAEQGHSLTAILAQENLPTQGKIKCSVYYNQQTYKLQCQAYSPKPVKRFKLLEVPDLDYSYKYFDRTALESLFAQREDCEDIIITQNSCITDSYYANLAFFDGSVWWTPETYLLAGTKRAQLLQQGLLQEKRITRNHLCQFTQIARINAMMDLHEPDQCNKTPLSSEALK